MARPRSGSTVPAALPPWGVAQVWLGLLLVLSGIACKQESPLQVFGLAPSFSLTDQRGDSFGSDDLGGRVALANFIYTSCTDTCPLLSATMGQVQDQLKNDGLFGNKSVLLSFSLDPQRDTPPVLAAYGERFGVDGAAWKLLTGDADTLAQLAQDFRLGRPIPLPTTTQSPLINLAHSNRFILIDGSGQVRAYYPGEELNVPEVVRDIKRLTR